MKIIKPWLTEKVDSCCADVQVGKLVTRALNLTEEQASTVCESSSGYYFYEHDDIKTSMGYDSLLVKSSLNDISTLDYLKRAVGFHSVTDMEKYYLWSIYSSLWYRMP